MPGPTFEQLFASLTKAELSFDALSQLREWLASLAHPGECLALIEQSACNRPCPHCGCGRAHRCGQASGLQRKRCLGCRRSYNALTGTPWPGCASANAGCNTCSASSSRARCATPRW